MANLDMRERASPCLTSMPRTSLSSTPSNEEVFHHILRRGCKDVGPGGPGSISLRLFQALISHYYSGKPERVIKKKTLRWWLPINWNFFKVVQAVLTQTVASVWLDEGWIKVPSSHLEAWLQNEYAWNTWDKIRRSGHTPTMCLYLDSCHFSTMHLSTILAVTSHLLGERELSSRSKLHRLVNLLVESERS